MKKKQQLLKIFDKNKKYTLSGALDILCQCSSKKFEESIEASIQFNVVPKKNIIIKGFSVLKHNIGKKYSVAVFNDTNEEINNCLSLTQDDLQRLHKKNIKFDILLTSPLSIVKFNKVNKLLNSKKVMPDVKYGTVTTDVVGMLDKLNSNYVKYKIDKNYSLNVIVGKINLSLIAIKENIEQLIMDIKKQKPQNCKSVSVKSLVLSSTMGPGIKIDTDSINC